MGHAIWHIFACNLKQSQLNQENNEKAEQNEILSW